MSDDENDFALCAVVFILLLLFGCAPAPGRDWRTPSGEGKCVVESDWSGIPDNTPMLKCPNEKPPKLLLSGGKLCAPGDDECDPGPTASWGCVR